MPHFSFSLQGSHTPLHFAATKGHSGSVEQLLAAGADTEAKGKVIRMQGSKHGEVEGQRVSFGAILVSP